MDDDANISANATQTSEGGCLLNVADGEDALARENVHTCKSCGESQSGSPKQRKYYERVNKWNEKRRAYTKTENYGGGKKATSKVWKTKGSEREGKKSAKRKYEVSQCLSIHHRKNNKTGGYEKDLCGPKRGVDPLSKWAKESRSNVNRVNSRSSCDSGSGNCGGRNNQAGGEKKIDPPCGSNVNQEVDQVCQVGHVGQVDEDAGRNKKEEAQANEWRNEKSKRYNHTRYNQTRDPLMVKQEEHASSPFICLSEHKRHKQDQVGKTSDMHNMHNNAMSNETIVENEEKMAYSNKTIADSFEDVVSLSLRNSNGANLDASQFSVDHFGGDHANWNRLNGDYHNGDYHNGDYHNGDYQNGDYRNLLRNPTILMKPNEPNSHTCGPPLEKPNGCMIGRKTEKDMMKEGTKGTEKGAEKGTPKTSIYNERIQLEESDPRRNSHEEDILSCTLKMNDPFCTHNGGNNWGHSRGFPNTFASYYQPNGATDEGIYKSIYRGIYQGSYDQLRSRLSQRYYKWPPLSIKNPFAFIYKSAKFFGHVQEECKKRTPPEAQPHTTTTINIYAKRKKIYTKEEHIEEEVIRKLPVSKEDLLFNFEMDKVNSSENSSLQIWEGSTSKVKSAFQRCNWRDNKISSDFTKQFGVTPHQERLLKRLSGVEELQRCDTDEEGVREERKTPIMSMVQSAPEADERVNLPRKHTTDEEEKEEKPMNKHKRLIHVGKKDTDRNFDIFLSLFMKHEKKEEFLFCLICDEELTENSIFFQNCIKPMLDEYRRSKFEKVKKEKNTSSDISLNDIHINKIILEIMIPSIKKKYLKYVSGLYDKKEPTPNNDINGSDELQKEVLEINQKMENLNIKSLDKHSTQVYIKEASRYEKKIKLIEKPKWSNEQNLKKLLLKQQNYNPFTIFGTSIKEVHLEEVFTLDVYNNYVTNEDRFRNKIFYDLYVGKYIQNLYHKIDYQEWTFVLDSLKKQWKYFTNLECNMFLDPLLLEEILWYIDENKMYKDKSEEMYTYEYCFCPTPDPAKEMNLNDVKHFATSMAERYTFHQDVKYKKLSLNEERFSPHKTLILKYDDVSMDQDVLTYAGRQKEKMTKEALLFNVPRPSSTFYYDSDFFENKIKKHMFRKKVKHCKGNLDVNSPSGKEEEPFTIKYKSKKWTSQKFFDNFFSNYYLYNFDRSNRMYNSII